MADSVLSGPGVPTEPTEESAYLQALHHFLHGRVTSARGTAHAATSAAAVADSASSFSELMASAVVELITELPDYDQESVSWAQRITQAALQSGRPAWAATARAVNACGLVTIGQRDNALREVVAAEVELAQEESWVHFADPQGKPHGTGAAHNNLGCALLILRLHEEGAHHFDRAAEVSRDRYGPGLATQIIIDLYNCAMLHLCWALDEESLGQLDRAQTIAARGKALVEDLANCLMSGIDKSWRSAVEVLSTGLDTILAPATLNAAHLRRVESFAEEGWHDTYLASPILVTQARLARLLDEPHVAISAAETADWLLGRTDPFTVDATLREAASAAPEHYSGFDPTAWRFQRDTERGALYEMLAAAGCSPFPS